MRKSVGLLMTGLEGSMTFSDIGGYNKLTGYETDGLVVTYAYTKDSEGHIVGIALEDGTASAQYIFDQDWILQGIVADEREAITWLLLYSVSAGQFGSGLIRNVFYNLR